MQSRSEKKNKCKKIGITGGIGSGKTLVSKIFELLGVPVYNADERARWIQDNDREVREALIKEFGEQTYNHNELNRSFISGIVFGNPEKLSILNGIVHPRVTKDFQNWLEEKKEYPYVLKEAAIFFEAGTDKDMDKMITVYSPDELRIKRVMKRDPQRSEEDVRKIIARQMSDEEKVKRSDYTIYNDDAHMLIPQVVELDEKFRKNK